MKTTHRPHIRNQIMKTVVRTAILVALLYMSSGQSFGLISTQLKPIPKKWAEQELHMQTEVNPLNTNQVTVHFEFSPSAKLAGFNYVRLKIYSELYETSDARGEIGHLLSSCEVQPRMQTKDKVVVAFTIDAKYLNRTEVQIVLFNDEEPHEHSNPNVDGHGYLLWLWR
jgi:hypothetical protein